MALAQEPKVLLLDEPFAGLSVDERRDVQRLLVAIPRDVTVIMIEHDMDVALDLADRITLLHFGKVIVEGTRAEVVADAARGRSTLAVRGVGWVKRSADPTLSNVAPLIVSGLRCRSTQPTQRRNREACFGS